MLPPLARLRANPAYELVLLDRLEPGERELVGGVAGEDQVYGVLRPRAGSALAPRVVSPETALLFLSLAEPGAPPQYARAGLGADLDATVERLVLDAVLELEQGGGYVSGAAAARICVGREPAGGQGRIGELTLAALRHAQELGPLDEALLAMRLYLYGGLPISPAVRERWPDDEAVAAFLGIAPGGAAHAALQAGWLESGGGEAAPAWRSWRPRQVAGDASGRRGASFKLYVSPAVEALPEAVRAVVETLPRLPGVSAFKLGRGVEGICRPDKLVAYFDSRDDLRRAVESLRPRLAGCAAHGVPFTAAIAADGLLSWGADPPRSADGPAESWRLWVAERLAEYLSAARSEPGGVEPWRFALERLRLAGIDTDTWVPAGDIWSAALVGA